VSSCDRPSSEAARIAALAADGPLPETDVWISVDLGGAALAISGHVRAAVAFADRGLDIARQRGDRSAFGYLSMIRSRIEIDGGLLVEAETDARDALEAFGREDQQMPIAAAVLIDALVEQGELDAAERVLTDADLADEHPMDWILSHFVHMARARLRF